MSNALPPNRRSLRLPLTPETIAALREELGRTGMGSARLLRGAQDRPPGLSAGIVDSWLQGAAASAIPDHLSYVLARWATLPTRRRMPLTPEMSAKLHSEFSRTGMGPASVLRATSDCPIDLTYQIVNAWASASVQIVRVEHWEYLMAMLGRMPDAAAPSRSRHLQRQARQAIAEHDLAELHLHRERTGIGGAVLLRNATDSPPGLTPTMISSWLSGVTKMADPAHVAYVLARYRAWP